MYIYSVYHVQGVYPILFFWAKPAYKYEKRDLLVPFYPFMPF